MFIRLYTYISSYMCGNTELFSKNKRQKSLECVKNIISLHQLSWKQSFYLKERLIPIEDLKRSPVKAVAFFLPYISEFCDNRGKRIRNFVIFTTKTHGILWFSSRFPLEFCDNVVFLHHNNYNTALIMKLLRRKIDEYLKNWKENKDKMPLIIKGARQVGNSLHSTVC